MLASVVHCARDTRDPTSQKVAFQVLTRMAIAWGGALEPVNPKKKPPAPVANLRPMLPGFDAWVVNTLVPLLFTVPGICDSGDAGSSLVLHEVAYCHRALYAGQNEKYAGYLDGKVLSECAADVRLTFLNGLRGTGEVKAFAKSLKRF